MQLEQDHEILDIGAVSSKTLFQVRSFPEQFCFHAFCCVGAVLDDKVGGLQHGSPTGFLGQIFQGEITVECTSTV